MQVTPHLPRAWAPSLGLRWTVPTHSQPLNICKSPQCSYFGRNHSFFETNSLAGGQLCFHTFVNMVWSSLVIWMNCIMIRETNDTSFWLFFFFLVLPSVLTCCLTIESKLFEFVHQRCQVKPYHFTFQSSTQFGLNVRGRGDEIRPCSSVHGPFEA